MNYFISEAAVGGRILPFLLQSVHQGISVIDQNYNIVLINQAACQMLDIPIEQLHDDPSLENLFRIQAERGDYGEGDVDAQVNERMQLARMSLDQEIERERPDGRTIRIQGTSLGEDGYITILTDVTEQKLQQVEQEHIQEDLQDQLQASIQEVRYNRDLLVNAINAVEDGLIVFDENGNLVLANGPIQMLYPSIKRHLDNKTHISKIEGFSLPDRADHTDHQLAEGGQPSTETNLQRFFVEQKLHDGNWYRIEQSATANGGRIAVFSDITTYKDQTGKLQEHTNKLVKMLQKEIALSDTQKEFVSMASHEFKTPLAIIDSNAQRIRRRSGRITEEKLNQRIGNIRSSVERMQYLINRFMDFSADEISGLKLDARTLPFRGALEKLCVSHTELDQQVNLQWDLSDLPELANYDENLLDQCFSNILSNAIKYSPPGAPITVTGRATDRYLLIDVEDEGVGIPKAELSRIFNKYYRASTSSGIAGTGIGLNFAQMVLKEHGGHIELASEVGKGSCFTIYLPRALGEEAQPHQQAS